MGKAMTTLRDQLESVGHSDDKLILRFKNEKDAAKFMAFAEGRGDEATFYWANHKIVLLPCAREEKDELISIIMEGRCK
jgi:hypothetical protein